MHGFNTNTKIGRGEKLWKRKRKPKNSLNATHFCYYFVIIVTAVVLTWIIPGEYARYANEKGI